MQQRKLGFVLLGGGALCIVLGVVMLVIGFVSSEIGPIYFSIGLTVVAALACLVGTVLLLVSAAK